MVYLSHLCGERPWSTDSGPGILSPNSHSHWRITYTQELNCITTHTVEVYTVSTCYLRSQKYLVFVIEQEEVPLIYDCKNRSYLHIQ